MAQDLQPPQNANKPMRWNLMLVPGLLLAAVLALGTGWWVSSHIHKSADMVGSESTPLQKQTNEQGARGPLQDQRATTGQNSQEQMTGASNATPDSKPKR